LWVFVENDGTDYYYYYTRHTSWLWWFPVERDIIIVKTTTTTRPWNKPKTQTPLPPPLSLL
jgi:hypothetical protein